MAALNALHCTYDSTARWRPRRLHPSFSFNWIENHSGTSLDQQKGTYRATTRRSSISSITCSAEKGA